MIELQGFFFLRFKNETLFLVWRTIDIYTTAFNIIFNVISRTLSTMVISVDAFKRANEGISQRVITRHYLPLNTHKYLERSTCACCETTVCGYGRDSELRVIMRYKVLPFIFSKSTFRAAYREWSLYSHEDCRIENTVRSFLRGFCLCSNYAHDWLRPRKG